MSCNGAVAYNTQHMPSVPKKQNEKKKGVVIYQAKNGAIELRGDFTHETIWATQAQIAEVFAVQRPAITKHLSNIFATKELDEKSVCSILEHTAKDGKKYKTAFYNLDAIISVGYRINSQKATDFRIWATKTLRSYIVDGFAINKSRIAKNYRQFLGVVDDLKKLLPPDVSIDPKDTIELVSLFADTWLSLDAYDKDTLSKGTLTKKRVELDPKKVTSGLAELKTELLRKSEATDVFGVERVPGAVESIIGNVKQSFGGKDLYASVEEKAAHLFYFMVKNHPFTDGNKRSGAFAFVWLLKQGGILNTSKLTPSALTALTILVAGSDSSEKEKVIALILNLISK